MHDVHVAYFYAQYACVNYYNSPFTNGKKYFMPIQTYMRAGGGKKT